MHCSLCCGGGDGGGSGRSGSDGSADWTQYCNLHCVMGVVVVFFPKLVAQIHTECMHCNLCCGGCKFLSG